MVWMGTEGMSVRAQALGQGSYQGHAERAAHDSMEEVMCSRARHNEEFTDEKVFPAGIV